MGEREWEGLRSRYPAWRIRESADGACLLATRLDRLGLSRDEMLAGLCMTLVEDTADHLIRALVTQTEIERRL